MSAWKLEPLCQCGRGLGDLEVERIPRGALSLDPGHHRHARPLDLRAPFQLGKDGVDEGRVGRGGGAVDAGPEDVHVRYGRDVTPDGLRQRAAPAVPAGVPSLWSAWGTGVGKLDVSQGHAVTSLAPDGK